MHLSFALSISHFVSSVGADAGFAALIGLAILVLLYFAHAREASTLREQLSAALQRIETLERQPTSAPLATPAPVPRPALAPATAARPTAAPATAAAGAGPPLAAPAGVGAPALIDATRAVPAFEELDASAEGAEVDGRKEGVRVAALSAPGGTGTAAPPTAPPPPMPTRRPQAPVAQPSVGRTPSPVTAAAGGNGSSPPRPGDGLLPGSLLREGIPGRRRRRSARWLIPALVAVVAVAAVVVVLVLVTGGSTPTPAHRVVHHSTTSQMAEALRKVAPSSVTVSVLNGTTVNQLAHRTSQRLSARGFKQGLLATASDQFVHKTIVGYVPGRRLDALVVAHALKLTTSAVAPVQSSATAIACPGSAPCSAQVIVTVGTDLANAP